MPQLAAHGVLGHSHSCILRRHPKTRSTGRHGTVALTASPILHSSLTPSAVKREARSREPPQWPTVYAAGVIHRWLVLGASRRRAWCVGSCLAGDSEGGGVPFAAGLSQLGRALRGSLDGSEADGRTAVSFESSSDRYGPRRSGRAPASGTGSPCRRQWAAPYLRKPPSRAAAAPGAAIC